MKSVASGPEGEAGNSIASCSINGESRDVPGCPRMGAEMDHEMACMAFCGPAAKVGDIATLALSDG